MRLVSRRFLEGELRGRRGSKKGSWKVLEIVVRRKKAFEKGFLRRGFEKASRRQKDAISESTTPLRRKRYRCCLLETLLKAYCCIGADLKSLWGRGYDEADMSEEGA